MDRLNAWKTLRFRSLLPVLQAGPDRRDRAGQSSETAQDAAAEADEAVRGVAAPGNFRGCPARQQEAAEQEEKAADHQLEAL